MNVLERETATTINLTPPGNYPILNINSQRYEDDNPVQANTDNETDLDFNRSVLTNLNDDDRPATSSFVTNRLSAHLNERLLGIPRPSTRPKSTAATPNRTILDIRSIQPTIQAPNLKRITEQQQHQRQRVMMVFGKQGSTEGLDKTSMISSRSFHVTINERKQDDSSVVQDTNSSTISKLFPIQADNIPMNIVSRYDNTSLMNKPLAIRASSVKKINK